ncbi:hypothetical protein LQL77_30425 [Rhodococcus cerastii]|nr:hypothetical protein [Rhodococcus cerastii]
MPGYMVARIVCDPRIVCDHGVNLTDLIRPGRLAPWNSSVMITDGVPSRART